MRTLRGRDTQTLLTAIKLVWVGIQKHVTHTLAPLTSLCSLCLEVVGQPCIHTREFRRWNQGMVPLCPCVLMPPHPFGAYVPLNHCSLMPMHSQTLVSVYPCAFAPSYPYSLLSSCPHTIILLHPHAHVPSCTYTIVTFHPSTIVPLHPCAQRGT